MAESAGAVAQIVGAAAQAAGTVKSLTTKAPKMPKAADVATRDSAADVLSQSQSDEDRRRRLVSQGAASNMLTGTGGVLSSKENKGKVTLGGS